jgi:acetoacetyl-CoA synthetase
MADPCWIPRDVEKTAIYRFANRYAGLLGMEELSYRELHKASVSRMETFWRSVADFFELEGELGTTGITGWLPSAHFFPDASINYAQQAFSAFNGNACVYALSEGSDIMRLSATDFWSEVARLRSFLVSSGVARGDTIAGYLGNQIEALVALMAAASLGAVWTCCSPDFGPTAVIDRLSQARPKVLIAKRHVTYRGQAFDRGDVITSVVDNLPTVESVIMVDEEVGTKRPTYAYGDVGAPDADLEFEPVGFEHPLWVLYSSGTTGIPKAIIHGHGGIVLEHLKLLGLHAGAAPGKKFFWYTTTGWMMWNVLAGSVLVGADPVLYDGAPLWPDPGFLWRLAGELKIDYLGISAPLINACMKAGVQLDAEIGAFRPSAVGSTGAPLTEDGFDYFYRFLPEVQLVSLSGGTDVCTAFLGGSPMNPVWRGRLSAPALGASVKAVDANGEAVVGKVGELVIDAPMPSMPVGLLNDPSGKRYLDAYFSTFPGLWRHGDWVTVYEDGSSVIWGRSDSTLNRGGIRMGTAEFYEVVERMEEVEDALVVDTSSLGDHGELILFVVLNRQDSEELFSRIRDSLRTELSPRHVPDRIVQISEIPKTLNGKKLEVPVKRLFLGEELDAVASKDAVTGYGSLQLIAQMAKEFRLKGRS